MVGKGGKLHLEDGAYPAQRSSFIGKQAGSDRDANIVSPQPFDAVQSGSSTKKEKNRDKNYKLFEQAEFNYYEPQTSASAPNGGGLKGRQLDDEDMSPDVRFHQASVHDPTQQHTSGSATLHSFLPNIEKKSMQENHNFVGRSPPSNQRRKTILIGNGPNQAFDNNDNMDTMLRSAIAMDGASRSGERNHSNLRNFDATTANKGQHASYLRTVAQG